MAYPRRYGTSSEAGSSVRLAKRASTASVETDPASEDERRAPLPDKFLSKRPPPSSFAFPFQAHPGNPDPGLSIPGVPRRRASLDHDPPTKMFHLNSSLTDLRKPNAPFMADAAIPRSSSTGSLYSQSAAANMIDTSPTHSFRAPFLSPASRPASSLWSPPTQNHTPLLSASPSASTTLLPLKSKPPLPSTRLTAPLHPSEKPWLATTQPRARLSYFTTLLCILLGIAGAAYICWQGISTIDLLPDSDLCLVLHDDFSSPALDTSVWNQDVQLGGFGNGEFEMTTNSPDNLFLRNSQLYIMPTFTSDKVPNTLNGATYTLDGCTVAAPALPLPSPITSGTNGTSTNGTRANNTTVSTPAPAPVNGACTAIANAALGTVINPVQSARINTQGKKSIKYGKVQFRAKLPTGDWLWPAIWLLPKQPSPYGAWPISGSIQILQARGNPPTYPAQGTNYILSSLTYGPFPALSHTLFGWLSLKRSSFASSFHTYTMEWTEDFVRFSIDSLTHATLHTQTKAHTKKNTYWEKAGFPQTARNGTDAEDPLAVVQNPYDAVQGSTRAAPFDQKFYLIIDLAAGGTSGWFPDQVGGKPWFDASPTAMRDFARAQDTWGATWPSNPDDRAFRIDYVKMWEKCK